MSADDFEFAKTLNVKYGVKVRDDVIASIYSGKPKIPSLLSRASFRADAVRSNPQVHRQRERRHLLRNILGLAVTLPVLVWVKVAFFTPQAETPAYVSSGVSATNGRVLTSAANLPPNQSLVFNDPNLGPFILIHLDNGQFVAYSSICTHAGCEVQFNPYAKDIACPCHGAVYDPYNNAQVVAGPAPYPLQKISVQYDPSSGNIYLLS
jgi:thiosulfate dehydrogenase [quinone] large subunit